MATVAMLVACRRDSPAPMAGVAGQPEVAVGSVTVRDVQLGNAIGEDRAIVMPVTTFDAQDTIYVAIATGRVSDSTLLMARWLFDRDGRREVIDSMAQTIPPGGPVTTEFHVANPGGWPAGSYQVEVFAGNRAVATRDYEVR